MAVTATGARRPRSKRREEILAAAATLFRERGYDATGIDDIGAAVSITGPGVYRHFVSKEEILETLLVDRGTHALEQVQQVVADASSPAAALDALARVLGRVIVEHRDVSVVAVYERRTLAPATRAAVDRLERLNIEEWVHVVSELRTDLNEAEVRTAVHAVLSMAVAVVNYDSGLHDDNTAAMIESMVRAGLAPRATKRARA
jgi:AcrR family transcriptional regulator